MGVIYSSIVFSSFQLPTAQTVTEQDSKGSPGIDFLCFSTSLSTQIIGSDGIFPEVFYRCQTPAKWKELMTMSA